MVQAVVPRGLQRTPDGSDGLHACLVRRDTGLRVDVRPEPTGSAKTVSLIDKTQQQRA